MFVNKYNFTVNLFIEQKNRNNLNYHCRQCELNIVMLIYGWTIIFMKPLS